MENIKHIHLTYDMYIVEPASRRFRSMESNQTIASLFDFLNQLEQVELMIESTQIGRPAMEAVIENIELRFPFNEEFDLEVNYRNRQIIGSMIRFIMGHYGFCNMKAKKMNKGRYIKTAIVFRRYERQ